MSTKGAIFLSVLSVMGSPLLFNSTFAVGSSLIYLAMSGSLVSTNGSPNPKGL